MDLIYISLSYFTISMHGLVSMLEHSKQVIGLDKYYCSGHKINGSKIGRGAGWYVRREIQLQRSMQYVSHTIIIRREFSIVLQIHKT